MKNANVVIGYLRSDVIEGVGQSIVAESGQQVTLLLREPIQGTLKMVDGGWLLQIPVSEKMLFRATGQPADEATIHLAQTFTGNRVHGNRMKGTTL